MDIYLGFVYACLLSLANASQFTTQTPKFQNCGFNMSATCDDVMWLFVDGEQLVGNSSDWRVRSEVHIPANTKVIEIHCLDSWIHGGILASSDNGLITDGAWKCSSDNRKTWKSAFLLGKNGRTAPDISPEAIWIWTDMSHWMQTDHRNHTKAICKIELATSQCPETCPPFNEPVRKTTPIPTTTATIRTTTPSKPKPGFNLTATCDNDMKLFVDGNLKATSSNWRDTSQVIIPANTESIEIHCMTSGIVGGILASSNNGLLTDGAWNCSSDNGATWNPAYEVGPNGGAVPDISPEAEWIWTTGCIGDWTYKYTGKKHKKNVICKIDLKPVIDGGWSALSPFSSCSATCGEATKWQTRTCSNPLPSNGGEPCDGSDEVVVSCSLSPCGGHSCPYTDKYKDCPKWKNHCKRGEWTACMNEDCPKTCKCSSCGVSLCSSTEGCPLVKNKLLTTLPQLNKQFLVSFEFLATQFINGWQNVIHFTENGSCCDVGKRVPAFWVSNSGQLYPRFAVNGNGDYGIMTTKKYSLNEWHKVEFSQKLENNKYIYKVIIDGVKQIEVENKQPKIFSNVKVYAADPWSNSLKGSLKNLFINTEGTNKCEGLTLRATCDNNMKIFTDTKLLITDNDWKKTSEVEIPENTKSIEIHCYDLHVVGGILASFDNGLKTDGNWSCSADGGSTWNPAYEIGSNGMSPWGVRPHISTEAKWIWTGKDTYHGKHKNVICKISLGISTTRATIAIPETTATTEQTATTETTATTTTVFGCKEVNVNYGGNDIPGSSPNSQLSWELCKKHCQKNRRCQAWTFRIQDGLCWIKTEVNRRTSENGLVSGPRDCGEATTTTTTTTSTTTTAMDTKNAATEVLWLASNKKPIKILKLPDFKPASCQVPNPDMELHYSDIQEIKGKLYSCNHLLCQTYSKEDNTWKTIPGKKFKFQRQFSAGTVIGDKWIVQGGRAVENGKYINVKTAEVWSPGTGNWVEAPQYKSPLPVRNACLLNMNGKIMQIGGYDNEATVGTNKCFLDGHEVASLKFARNGPACAVFLGEVWVAGGYNFNNQQNFDGGTVEIYDRSSNKWKEGAKLPEEIKRDWTPKLIPYEGDLYYVGGEQTSKMYKLNLNQFKWEEVGDIAKGWKSGHIVNTYCDAIHGGWSSWSKCSKTCKDGALQTRTCTNPTPAYGGRACSGTTSQKCNQHINCRYIISGISTKQVSATSGSTLWTDRSYFITQMPQELVGSTLFQPAHYVDKSTIEVFSPHKATIYVGVYEARDGGLMEVLPGQGWTLRDGWFVQWNRGAGERLHKIWSKQMEEGETISFTTTKNRMTLAIFISEGSRFERCVHKWCLQSSTSEQYTRCEEARDGGNTCVNPQVKYGSTEGGIPHHHKDNDFNVWCKQIFNEGSSGTATLGPRDCSAPKGKLFWCSRYDENSPKWCDWSDGGWKDSTLGSHSGCSSAITTLTCRREGLKLQFQLKGVTGQEKVTISIDGNEEEFVLRKEWQTFSYPRPSSGSFSVKFLNDNGPRDVYIRGHESQVADLLPDFASNKGWGCGTDNENERCSWLRNGQLAWNGIYTYNLKGQKRRAAFSLRSWRKQKNEKTSNVSSLPGQSGLKLQFQLKGKTGTEKVKVSVDDNEEEFDLKPEWRLFSYHKPSSGSFSVEFLNDIGYTDVFISGHESQVTDLLPNFPANKFLGCGTKNEDENCGLLRKGTLMWNGKYTYTLKGQ